MQALYVVGAQAFQVKRSAVAALASGNVTLVAAVSGMKIRVISLTISITTAAAVIVQTGAGGTALLPTINATGVFHFPENEGGLCETAAGALLNVNSGAAIVGTAQCTYAEVPVAID